MSVRQKAGRWVVEVYDPATRRKRHVRARDHGVAQPRTRREALAHERLAHASRDAGRPAGVAHESVAAFAARWPLDYAHGRGESTRRHNAERVRAFAAAHGDRPLRSITRLDARAHANALPGTVPALRAMFNDALADGLVGENPFARLGLARSAGREDIVVLTTDEVDRLAQLAVEVHGPGWGDEVAAMILWGAYTCCRPGETFAARRSLLDGDTYHLQRQFNSALGRETAPKHDSAGVVYVPPPARAAIARLPVRLGDDLLFRTRRGCQFRQESWSRTWAPIRAVFTAEQPLGHHLNQRLALDPEDRLDFHELRHFGAAYMLNVLGLQPWVIAKQLRHRDEGALVLKLYGHPSRGVALDAMRRGFAAGAGRGIAATAAGPVQGTLGGSR
jgi:integrase